MSEIQAVLFDLDGTLADTRADIALSVNYMRETYGLAPLSLDEVTGYIGSGVKSLLQSVLHDKPEKPIDELIDEFREHYRDHCLDHTVLYDGILNVLQELHTRGIKMAVITNKPWEHSVKILRGLRVDHYFLAVIGGDTAARKKPAPDMLHQALEIIGVPAEKAIVIGDSEFDVYAARHAGVRVVGVRYGIGKLDRLHASAPDQLVDSPSELLARIF